jgi:hypothetical protein
MSAREGAILDALQRRLSDVRDRVAGLKPEAFADAADYLKRLQQSLFSDDRAGDDTAHEMAASDGVDCVVALGAISLTSRTPPSTNQPAASAQFLESLKQCRNDPEERFRLLAERFSWPPNFSLSCEAEIREHVLMRLMVQDRARIEEQSIASVNADDLLLKLNLVAVHSLSSDDLRFLDALNYYYELLPTDWVPRARHVSLFVSFLGLYARALHVAILRNQTIAHCDTREHSARSAADI